MTGPGKEDKKSANFNAKDKKSFELKTKHWTHMNNEQIQLIALQMNP
jgi:hypothetical protein